MKRGLRFIRFGLVGLMGMAAQLSTLVMLSEHFGLPLVPSAAIAVEIAVLHNFIWHERFTWPDKRGASRVIRLLRFHLANGFVSLGGNTLLTYWLAERLKAPVLPSVLASIVLCATANFLLADRWVYQPRLHKPQNFS